MDVVSYKDFEINAAPYQLTESGEWTLNVYITLHKTGETVERNFSAADHFKTREEAVTHCHNFGRLVIDGKVKDCSVADMK